MFKQGIPELSDDLRDISLNRHHILVFDDLMTQAIDSPVLSKLFTQGRHRNVSVILLLQNMFPKGKFNTDISRNAQYMVLFRSPSDRKQIDMIAERIFAKDRPNFMSGMDMSPAKPYGYVLIDNQPKTTSENQVICDVFGQCQCYRYISTNSEKNPETIEPSKQSVKSVKRKVELSIPRAKKQQSKPAKNQRVKAKRAKKQAKPKTKKKQCRKPAIYQPSESSEEEYSDNEHFSLVDGGMKLPMSFEEELNAIATRGHLAKQRNGVKMMYY